MWGSAAPATLKSFLKTQYSCEGQMCGGEERRTQRPARHPDFDAHIKKSPEFGSMFQQNTEPVNA